MENIIQFSDSSGDVDLLDISMKVNVNNSELNTKDKVYSFLRCTHFNEK